MNKKSEFEAILIIPFILILIIMCFGIISLWERMETMECGLGLKECPTAPIDFAQPDRLADWEEECIENITIERYEFIIGVNWDSVEDFCYDKICYGEIMCLNEFGKTGEIGEVEACKGQEECLKFCVDKYSEKQIGDTYFPTNQYIRYWNETECVKKILVKKQ